MAFFTREQILEIATRLSQLGISDQELPQAEALTGAEQFAVVQEGTSKKTSVNAISSLISAAINSTELDIFNVTRFMMEQESSDEIVSLTFEEALAATPVTIKRVGQMITYYDSDTSSWRMWRFVGTDITSWYTEASWEEFTAASSLATVASTGDYNDLLNKKTKVSELTNDTGYITSYALNNYYDKNTTDDTFATQASLTDYATKTWVGNQGYKTTVSWDDLTEDSSHQFVSSAEKTTWGSKQAAITNDNKLSSSLISGLADVATSGSAADITADSTHRFVTDAEKTTWTAKQDAITGAASTILTSNLTASKAVVVNSSGKIAASGVTATELGRLEGVTSSIQTQLNAKQATISDLAAIRSGAALGATAYQMDQDGIPVEDLDAEVQASLALADSAYQIPSGGIPSSAMATAVQTSLGKANTALQSNSALNGANLTAGTVAKTALASGVQDSLTKADSALQSVDLSGYYTKSQVDDRLSSLNTIMVCTGAQRRALPSTLPTGTCVYDTSDQKPYWYNGSQWKDSESVVESSVVD